jgi:hypothetical protein
VSWFRFDPLVIPSNLTTPILLEAKVAGTPSRVSLDLAVGTGGTIELKDDSSGGDRTAGDGVFTASIPAAAVLGALRADDVQRVFVGYLNVFNDTTRVLRGNMFADVLTPDINRPQITQLAPDLQATSNLVNIVDPQYLSDGSVTRVAQTFYRQYNDGYDFLNIVSTPSRFLNRDHVIVRNDVDGIGLQRSDASAAYGSNGRLRGFSRFPLPNFFDGASVGYSHETGHQWINHLAFGPFFSGVPHWPLSSMATGTMGFSIGGGGGEGGSFSCDIVDDGKTTLLSVPQTQSPIFNDFDLYLMGLLAPAVVRGQVVLNGLSAAPTCTGQIYTGSVTRVDANTIIGGAGQRSPDSSGAPKDFRAATILVSRDGLVSSETMWLYSWLTERAELRDSTPIHEGFVKATGNPFHVMTRGLGTIATALTVSPDFSLRAAQAAQAVSRGTTATFTISALPTLSSFDDPITFACGNLPPPLSCAFSPPQVTPGATGADVSLAIATGAAGAGGSGALVLVLAAAMFSCRRRVPAVALALLAVANCGGGSTGATSSPPSGSSSAVYSITVTGTSGSLTHSVLLSLIVQ